MPLSACGVPMTKSDLIREVAYDNRAGSADSGCVSFGEKCTMIGGEDVCKFRLPFVWRERRYDIRRGCLKIQRAFYLTREAL